MDENLKLIQAEFEEHKGQFVIPNNWKIERFVAIVEDEMDYYYVTYDGRQLKYHTCVGSLIKLKGYLKETDYTELVRMSKLNHYDQRNFHGCNGSDEMIAFNVQHKSELIGKLALEFKLLAEICWEIN